MPSKRSKSKSRSTSRGRVAEFSPKKAIARSASKKQSASATKKTPQKKASKSKSRSQSASRKANTAPAAQQTQRRGGAQTPKSTPVARPSRSRSRTRVDSESSSSTTSGRPTSSYFEEQSRPRRAIVAAGAEAANMSARTARYVAKNAQRGVYACLGTIKTNLMQKYRRSCLYRPSIAKVTRHLIGNIKWYLALIVIILAIVIAYKFERFLVTQMHEIKNQLSDFIETQRKIFGENVKALQGVLRDAKRKYLDSESHTTNEPPIASNATVSPQDEVYRQQQQTQQRKTLQA